MATIIKRKKSYSVVYNYKDENGKTKQKWETCHNYKEALKRKAEVESQLMNGEFIVPSKLILEEFMNDFVTLYGEPKWSLKMYDSCVAMITNYINPLIGTFRSTIYYSKNSRPIYKNTTKDKTSINQ